MSYITIDDISSTLCPSRKMRVAVTQYPKSGNAFSVKVTIPESEFQKSLIYKADKVARNASEGIGARNDIIRGIVIKPETFATLELIKGGQAESTIKFSDFLLQEASEVTEEKYQLVETFGEPIGFFYGTRPKIYQYSGLLMNTEDYAWRDMWKSNYETELRGTKCVENKTRAYLTYDFVLREGYLLAMNINQSANTPNNVRFSFTMFVTREMNLMPYETGLLRKTVVDAEHQAEDLRLQAQIEEIKRRAQELKVLGRFREATKKLVESNEFDKNLLREKWKKLALPPMDFEPAYEAGGEEKVQRLIKAREDQIEQDEDFDKVYKQAAWAVGANQG